MGGGDWCLRRSQMEDGGVGGELRANEEEDLEVIIVLESWGVLCNGFNWVGKRPSCFSHWVGVCLAMFLSF